MALGFNISTKRSMRLDLKTLRFNQKGEDSMTPMEKVRELRARTDVHFNCCQSVLVAFAEDMGLTE